MIPQSTSDASPRTLTLSGLLVPPAGAPMQVITPSQISSQLNGAFVVSHCRILTSQPHPPRVTHSEFTRLPLARGKHKTKRRSLENGLRLYARDRITQIPRFIQVS